jgi:uncharacterized protein
MVNPIRGVIMPDPAVIDRFLAEPRLGFVGASRDPRQFANSVYRHLRDGGRSITPVHPEADAIEGDPAVASVADLPSDVSAVLVMLDAERAGAVVDDCIEHGVEMVWLHRGAGPGAVSESAVAACRAAGLAVVDGACPMMFAEPVGWFHRMHRTLVKRRFVEA